MRNREYLVEQTKNGYDRMAKDWAGTRMNFWKELTEVVTAQIQTLLTKQDSDTLSVLDLGCGNARLYPEISKLPIVYNGCDVSAGLIEQAHKYHPKLPLVVCDARDTPYSRESFELVVSFAVLHHLPGETAQIAFLEEVQRVLKPEGVAIITVWNIWKTRRKMIWSQFIQNYFSDKRLPLGDTVMDFTHHKGTRFVHAFSKRELQRLVKKTNLQIVSLYTLARQSAKGCEENFVLIVKK